MNQNNFIIPKHPNHKFYFDFDDWVLQKIDPVRHDKIINTYQFYKKFNLERLGFVKAELVNQDHDLFLKVKKYVTSYPNEWTMSMLKDATLFHLKLFEKLYSLNLALKSSSLENILFENTRPVFSDLTTLTTRDEETLLPLNISDSELKNVVHKILLVIELLKHKKYLLIREILQEPRSFILRKKMLAVFLQNPELKTSWESAAMLHESKLSTKKSFVEQCEYLHDLAASTNVSPDSGNSVNYYENKNENFDLNNMADWKQKQKSVYKVITEHCPSTVLDIGANTGWFSFLAEREGARVISTDIDEASIDYLYQKSKIDNLNILSLVVPFSHITPRISCDLVMALAILHRFVFKHNMQLDYIFKSLSMVTKKILILEFVDLQDESLVSYAQMFPHLNETNKQGYNLDATINCGLKYFNEIKILDSHPQTRKLLVFKK